MQFAGGCRFPDASRGETIRRGQRRHGTHASRGASGEEGVAGRIPRPFVKTAAALSGAAGGWASVQGNSGGSGNPHIYGRALPWPRYEPPEEVGTGPNGTRIDMNHLTERQLISIFQDTLPAEVEEKILLHLAACESCERRTEAAIERYRTLRRDAARKLPPPPHRWRDIVVEMDRADANFPQPAHFEAARKSRPVWTGLAAGAALSGVLLLWPRPDANLRAETLLPRIEASVSRSPLRARQGLRVRTPSATFIRPAVLRDADRSDVNWRDRFRAAHYDWDDPVSPRAFSDWRNSVKHKSDRVIVSPTSSGAPRQFTIQTTTPENLLQDASSLPSMPPQVFCPSVRGSSSLARIGSRFR